MRNIALLKDYLSFKLDNPRLGHRGFGLSGLGLSGLGHRGLGHQGLGHQGLGYQELLVIPGFIIPHAKKII